MSNGNNNGHLNGTATSVVHTNGNGHRPDTAIIEGSELLWDGLSPAVIQALSQPIDSSLVSQRKGRGGRTFSYIEGHTAIDEANKVFGFGGWGFELVENVTLRRIETMDAKTGEVSVFHAYTAPVRVTVAGALPRTDICLLYTSPSPRDGLLSRMPSSA